MPTLPTFPTVLSNSILSEFHTCAQRTYIRYILNRDTPDTNVHLLFGGAFARGLEVTRRLYHEDGTDVVSAINSGLAAITQYYTAPPPPPPHTIGTKTLENCLLSFIEYFDTYPLATDYLQPFATPTGRSTVEFTFVEEVPECRHPETGDPILLSGKMDMLAYHTKYPSQRWIVDEKTAAKRWHNWSDQWTIRSQFPCYAWGTTRAGLGPITGAWVRGVIIYADRTEFNPIPITIHPWTISRWYKWAVSTINAMIHCHTNGYWPYNFGTACALRGSSCPFLNACQARNPEPYLARLPTNTYEPLRAEVE